MSETSNHICKCCTQSDEQWFLAILCRKYNIEMDKSNSIPFIIGPNYSHFMFVKSLLKGSSTAELLHDYVSNWAKDKDYPKKQLLMKIMTEQNMKYSDEAYMLYVDWVPSNNPETEPEYMRDFCNEFKNLFSTL
jgi:hypothetical protein